MYRRQGHVPPPLLPGATRVSSRSTFRVIHTDDLDSNGHVNEESLAARNLFMLYSILKSRGLNPHVIHKVTRATTLARLLYTAPAWRGFVLASDKVQI